MAELADAIRARLRADADPSLAPGQQAYMKSAMPFLGVRVPQARRIARAEAADATPAELLDGALDLWDAASHREERYAAMALLGVRSLRGDAVVVPVIDHMIRTGRWWDYTDELAHRLAELHDAHGAETAALVREWSTDDDLWIRRSAIISQLGRRERVERGVLEDVIGANLADTEFFIRKAIGWALRDYARVAPDWVRDYAAAQPLSPLSRREALRRL